VELSIEPGQSLGLMIRGGVEYNLGIFITGVDKDSVADRAGLMVSVAPRPFIYSLKDALTVLTNETTSRIFCTKIYCSL
jgi:hypothetical protein